MLRPHLLTRPWLDCAVALLVLGSTPSCLAQPCTQSQARQAARQAEKLRDWAGLRGFHSRFARCDDGEVADLVAEAVVRLLAQRWEDIDALAAEVRRDPPFKAYVLDHIDSTADTAQLERIKANASTRCPQAHASLCRDIARTVGQSL